MQKEENILEHLIDEKKLYRNLYLKIITNSTECNFKLKILVMDSL